MLDVRSAAFLLAAEATAVADEKKPGDDALASGGEWRPGVSGIEPIQPTWCIEV